MLTFLNWDERPNGRDGAKWSVGYVLISRCTQTTWWEGINQWESTVWRHRSAVNQIGKGYTKHYLMENVKTPLVHLHGCLVMKAFSPDRPSQSDVPVWGRLICADDDCWQGRNSCIDCPWFLMFNRAFIPPNELFSEIPTTNFHT